MDLSNIPDLVAQNLDLGLVRFPLFRRHVRIAEAVTQTDERLVVIRLPNRRIVLVKGQPVFGHGLSENLFRMATQTVRARPATPTMARYGFCVRAFRADTSSVHVLWLLLVHVLNASATISLAAVSPMPFTFIIC